MKRMCMTLLCVLALSGCLRANSNPLPREIWMEWPCDTPFGPAWDGVYWLSPSLNVVYDAINGLGLVYQAVDPNLTTWAGLTPSAFFQTLVDDPNAAAARSTLGLGSLALQNQDDVTITGGTITGVTALRAAGRLTSLGGDVEYAEFFMNAPGDYLAVRSVTPTTTNKVPIYFQQEIGTGAVATPGYFDADGHFKVESFIQSGVTAGVTATSPGIQGDNPITKQITQVSVCANPNDAVTAPAAVAGREFTVINNGAQTLEIWPASGDNLGAGANTAVTLAAGANATYLAYNSTNWVVK